MEQDWVEVEMDPASLEQWDVQKASAGAVTWQGREALKLNGLALLPGFQATNATIEVDIWAEGPCYPGIAFHAVDRGNFELVYAQPHTSGQWDAVQYDPVFRHSNSWQLHHGPAYQVAATVPVGEWFTLRVRYGGRQATAGIMGQPALSVARLAHEQTSGLPGLWTYLPAYFSNLRVACGTTAPVVSDLSLPRTGEGTVEEWLVEGVGAVRCEPGGYLLLNRYLPATTQEARISRRFSLDESGIVHVACGFSDELALAIDGQPLLKAQNTFAGFADRATRGYVEPDSHTARRRLAAGEHLLEAVVGVTESFGWGLILALHGAGLHLLPVDED